MPARLKALRRYAPRHVLDVKQEYEARFPGKRPGIYHFLDWQRLAFASEFVVGDNVLDVGVGNGALLHILRRSGRHRRICGIDLRRNSMLWLPDGVEFQEMNVCEMSFRTGEFDTVVCMEVIEHLPVDLVDRALAELRRVAKSRLLLSVPYREPFPLYHQDRPSGHKQSFDDDKIARLFPSGVGTLIPRGKVPWAFIAEQPSQSSARCMVLSEAEFRERVLPASESWLPVPGRAEKLLHRVKHIARSLSARLIAKTAAHSRT